MPVTVLECGPCTVLQVRTAERDGYHAVQLGFAGQEAEERHPGGARPRQARLTPSPSDTSARSARRPPPDA